MFDEVAAVHVEEGEDLLVQFGVVLRRRRPPNQLGYLVPGVELLDTLGVVVLGKGDRKLVDDQTHVEQFQQRVIAVANEPVLLDSQENRCPRLPLEAATERLDQKRVKVLVLGCKAAGDQQVDVVDEDELLCTVAVVSDQLLHPINYHL